MVTMQAALVLSSLVFLLAAAEIEGSGHHPPGAGHHPQGVGHHSEESAALTEASMDMAVADVAAAGAVSKAASSPGPCSGARIVLRVYQQADFQKRRTIPASQHVTMFVMADITLNDTLWLTEEFSCTWIIGQLAKGGGPATLTYPLNDKAAVVFLRASNIVWKAVHVATPLSAGAGACRGYPQAQRESMCAAVTLSWSYGVQVVRSRIRGRIELINAGSCRLDHLAVVAVGSRNVNPGAVTISYSGMGTKLVKANNIISNCDISGSDVGINMYYGAVGNVVANNYVHDFTLFGISCGFGVHTAGDCMLNRIEYNLVFNKNKITGRGYTSDSAGIYFNLHWWGPGNTATCNYVQGPGHCYYLDYASSGVTVNGGVCVSNDDGIKINTGKENMFKDIILIRPMWQTAYVSCQNYDKNNCLKDPGTYWDNVRTTSFDTPLIRKTFPAFNDFCSQATYRGQSCNPPGSAPAAVTGMCSGLPTGNNLTLFVQKTTFQAAVQNCHYTPVAKGFNYFQSNRLAMKNFKFNNYKTGDYGIDDKTSPVYKINPNFISCSKRNVGIKYVSDSAYSPLYNIPAPYYWSEFKTYKKP